MSGGTATSTHDQRSRIRRFVDNPYGFFLLAAVAGAVAGVATLLLVKLILLVQWIGYGEASEARFASIAAGNPVWRRVLVPVAGGLLVGLLLRRIAAHRYHGIADVMEACALNHARMPVRSGLFAAIATAVSLGSGAPLGREGPAVHIGASLSAWVAERLGLARSASLALLGCGAAAAVTVSFNTPIAAVIFALEVVVGYYTLRVFAPIVIAAMAAVIVRRLALGDEVLFAVPDYEVAHAAELLMFVLLGVVGALAARMLIRVAAASRTMFERFKVPYWLRPAMAGLLVGLVALQLPQVLSTGFESTQEVLFGHVGLGLLFALLLSKLLLVAISIGSGHAGGVFSPAVVIGALLGAAFWVPAEALFGVMGLPLASQGFYAAVGVAAMASALLGAPISTLLIVFEMTRDYDITLGVMTAAAVASTVMQQGSHASFFRWQLASRNIDITAERDASLLTSHRVRPLITQRYVKASGAATLGELESRLARAPRERVVVLVDEQDGLIGSLTPALLIQHAHGDEGEGLHYPAAGIAWPADYAIRPSSNIVTALQVMAEQNVDFAPVIDRGEQDAADHVVGVVYKADLLAAHYDVLKRAREEEFGIT